VGGEDRHIEGAVQQGLELVGVDALFGEKPQGVIERTFPERPPRPHGALALAVLEGLLGDVDQAEVDVEGAHHVGEDVGLQAVDQPDEALAQLGVLFLAQADEAFAQGFDGGQDLAAGLVAQHVAQQGAQQAHARAQFLVAGLLDHGVVSLSGAGDRPAKARCKMQVAGQALSAVVSAGHVAVWGAHPAGLQ